MTGRAPVRPRTRFSCEFCIVSSFSYVKIEAAILGRIQQGGAAQERNTGKWNKTENTYHGDEEAGRKPRNVLPPMNTVDEMNCPRMNANCTNREEIYLTFKPYFCVMGGTIPFMRRYSTNCP